MTRRLSRRRCTAAAAFAALAAALTTALAAQRATVPAMLDVIAPNTSFELIQDGFVFTEGPVGTDDGGLYFVDTQSKPARVFRMEPGGAVRPLAETQGVNGLALDAQGRLYGAEMFAKRVVRLDAAGAVAAVVTGGSAEHPLVQPNDLIVDARGGIFFTDPGTFDPKNTAATHVYYLDPRGTLHLVTDEIPLPNGLALSPDGRRLYVDDTKGAEISGFDVRFDGTTGPRTVAARLTDIPEGQSSGADGMTVDAEGRLFVTSRTGIQVFTPAGSHLGTIPTPRPAANVAFGGPGKRDLFVAARQGLYRLRTLTRGVARPGK